MTIEQARAILDDRPFVHRDRFGNPKDGGLNRPMGDRFITEISAIERPRIAETGTGLSTMLFLALDPEIVISVSPAPELHERTRAEAVDRGIDLAPLRFVDDRSETALPLLALVEGVELDVGFIDGNHGWPAVFVDFCYLNRMLRPGGLMFIDDVQVYAVAQLVCLLREQQPHYEFVSIDSKMATFRKGLDLPYLPDWRMEPFITSNTATRVAPAHAEPRPGALGRCTTGRLVRIRDYLVPMWRFRRRNGAQSGDAEVAVHATPRADALESADRLADEQRYEDALRLLTDANRRDRDRDVERRLVELRHAAFRAASWPQVRPAWPSVPDRYPGAGIPEISADELSVEGLRSAIVHHGALIVRGLVDDGSVRRLITDIDNSLAAYDAQTGGDDRPELAGWYEHFEPDRVSDRARKRFRGAVMTVESPPTLFDLLDTFERVGLGELVRTYFGEPPMLLARKGTLRRMDHGGRTGGWHQDGAFMGADIRSLNIWLALTHCGDDAPGLDIVGRRLDGLVQTGEGAFAEWATDPEAAEQVAAGTIVRPIFDPGDVLLFDQLNLHRTAIDPGMDTDRYAIETWLFAPSTYELMTAAVDDGYSPRDQLPIWF